ncbi:penicillin-binding protein [Sphingomonas lacunae]|uniref:Penicillin-binding protein 1A n=1 Tax=Sphingomonas lacunae TaxID=2698828 RepID=A0A6M4AUZ0_9SPHN|nr:transglycosylase domain-containing protein [Sphingomonas lacunae]QJQ32230.1 penicillin-binding protein [Sphingomonas lacunae]
MSDTSPTPDTGSASTVSKGKSLRLRLTREADGVADAGRSLFGGVRDWFSRNWHRRWFRWLVWSSCVGLFGLFLLWLLVIRDLPSADRLLTYEPPLPTIVRDVEGVPTHSFARERRVQLDYDEFPPLLVRAFLAAEDRTFWEHGGVDYPGIFGAVVDYVTKLGSGQRARGGSTITQQVAKNILLGDEYSISRKFREILLAYRIESVLTKQQILELYLNEIPLGRQSYGVQAAARAYFDKDVGELTLPEMAFLATLPKAPEKYGRRGQEQAALNRRAYVLREMLRAGWITEQQRAAAAAAPLGLVARRGSQFKDVGGYYMEEVRRELITRFGENADDGPHSVYGGGLWVRTAYNGELQDVAERAMRNAMLRYHGNRGWSGPLATIPLDSWKGRLQSSGLGVDFDDWRVAVVLEKAGGDASIGFPDGETGLLPSGYAAMAARSGGSAYNAMKPGDIILVKRVSGNVYTLRTVPGISGGFIAQSTHSGRVYAMQGGFDSRLQSFNRATQAERQPGSTIKPFVYATALDNEMTPASIIVDGPLCVDQSATLGRKCFRNSGGGAAGPQTMRWGLEQSRNLMTVATANQIGMDKVVATYKRLGIGEYRPYLAFALGAGETTVSKLTNAYAVLVNHGRSLTPRLIDYVQDRRGKVIFPANWRPCQGCNAQDWDGRPMPRFSPSGRQLMDPLTAYQTVHMLEGVIQRGTAKVLRDLNRPLFGKTGTTTGPTDVWFIGGTPDWVAGVYLGYDRPRNLGGYAAGGTMAAPIFKEYARAATRGQPPVPFLAPEGIRMVRIERRSGRRVFGAWPAGGFESPVIWEAFKPETEPRRTARSEEIDEERPATERRRERATSDRPAARRADRDEDFLDRQGQGGIY